MKKLDLSFSQLLFVVGTRAILGLGVGLLAADRLPRKTRRPVGFTLATLGLLTTVPAAISVFATRHSDRRDADMHAA